MTTQPIDPVFYEEFSIPELTPEEKSNFTFNFVTDETNPINNNNFFELDSPPLTLPCLICMRLPRLVNGAVDINDQFDFQVCKFCKYVMNAQDMGKVLKESVKLSTLYEQNKVELVPITNFHQKKSKNFYDTNRSNNESMFRCKILKPDDMDCLNILNSPNFIRPTVVAAPPKQQVQQIKRFEINLINPTTP